MVRPRALLIDDLHVGDVVLDTKKGVNGTITSINGTTANILFPGNAIPQSWVKLAGLSIVRPNLEEHIGQAGSKRKGKASNANDANVKGGKKHKKTTVINDGVINDNIDNVINAGVINAAVINAGVINDDVINDDGINDDVVNDGVINGSAVTTTRKDDIPLDLLPTLEEHNEVAPNLEEYNDVDPILEEHNDETDYKEGDRNNETDPNKNNEVNSNKCCLGNECKAINLDIQLANCSECKCEIHHVCTEEGICPEYYGCRRDANTTITARDANVTITANARDVTANDARDCGIADITIADIATASFPSDNIKHFFSDGTGKDCYINMKQLFLIISNYVLNAKETNKEIDESNIMMITADDRRGIDKDDDSSCIGYYSPPTSNSTGGTLAIRYKGTKRGWLIDLKNEDFRKLVNKGFITYKKPSALVPVSAPASSSAPVDIEKEVSELQVQLYIDSTYGEEFECKKAVYIVVAKSMLLSRVYQSVYDEAVQGLEDLNHPLLVKVLVKTEENEVTICSYESLPSMESSFLIHMKSSLFDALVKKKSLTTVKGFGASSLTTFPSLVKDGDRKASSILHDTISRQKGSSTIKFSYPVSAQGDAPVTSVHIQQLKHSKEYDMSFRESTKASYIIVNSDGSLHAKTEFDGKMVQHDILFKYVCAHFVISKEAAIMLEKDGYSKKEITKLLLCNVYCRIKTRKEKEFILLKVLTVVCNKPPTCYLVYNTEKRSTELLKLNISQIDCDFSKVVPDDTLVAAKDKMIEFLYHSHLLFDLSLGINIANPKFDSMDLETASKELQIKEISIYVPLNYPDFHEAAHAHLDSYYDDESDDDKSSDHSISPKRQSRRINDKEKLEKEKEKLQKGKEKLEKDKTPAAKTPAANKSAAASKSSSKRKRSKRNSDGADNDRLDDGADNDRFDEEFNDHGQNYYDTYKHPVQQDNSSERLLQVMEQQRKDYVELQLRNLESQEKSRQLELKKLQFRSDLEVKNHELEVQKLALHNELEEKKLTLQNELELKKLQVQNEARAKEASNNNGLFELALTKMVELGKEAVSSKNVVEENSKLQAKNDRATVESNERVANTEKFTLEMIKAMKSVL
jgi:hypothetical protein